MTAPADVDLVERVLRENGVEQQLPAPAWSAYLHDLARQVTDALSGAFPSLRKLGGLSGLLGPLATAVLAVGVVLVLLLLVRIAVLALRARRRGRAGSPAPEPADPAARALAEKDAAAWRAEIDGRLARGDLAGALEAAWWWFARRLSAARVERSWTSGELLAHVRRRDLAPLAVALDRLLYGPGRPSPEDVRRFVARGEAVLP